MRRRRRACGSRARSAGGGTWGVGAARAASLAGTRDGRYDRLPGLPRRAPPDRQAAYRSGLTHVLDKGLSLANLESLVEGVGEYVDVL